MHKKKISDAPIIVVDLPVIIFFMPIDKIPYLPSINTYLPIFKVLPDQIGSYVTHHLAHHCLDCR